MKWQHIPGGELRAAEGALWSALGVHADSVARRLREDKEFARNVAESAIAADEALTQRLEEAARATWQRCIEAMGFSFVAPFEIESMFAAAIKYESTDIKNLVETCPDSLEMERLSKDGHILLPGPPRKMNLEQVAQLVHVEFWPRLDQAQFVQQEVVRSGWIAITKEPLAASIGLAWEEQRRTPPPSANIPNAAEVAWCIGLLNCLRSKVVWKHWVNTASQVNIKGRVCQVKAMTVGASHLCYDFYESAPSGVLACRKFRKK